VPELVLLLMADSMLKASIQLALLVRLALPPQLPK
jgi:hypothetical protein